MLFGVSKAERTDPPMHADLPGRPHVDKLGDSPYTRGYLGYRTCANRRFLNPSGQDPDTFIVPVLC